MKRIRWWHWLVAIGGLVMLLLCGAVVCALSGGVRSWYHVTLENHSDKVVLMHFLGGDLAVAPCTIEYYGLTEGPPLKRGLRLRVKDEQGRVLSDYNIVPGKEATPPAAVTLRYPPEGTLGCGKAVVGQYMVGVWNKTSEDLVLTFAGQDYCLAEGEERTIGPVGGSVFDYVGPSVFDDTGSDRVNGRDLTLERRYPSHRVGDMPYVYYGIKWSSLRETRQP